MWTETVRDSSEAAATKFHAIFVLKLPNREHKILITKSEHMINQKQFHEIFVLKLPNAQNTNYLKPIFALLMHSLDLAPVEWNCLTNTKYEICEYNCLTNTKYEIREYNCLTNTKYKIQNVRV